MEYQGQIDFNQPQVVNLNESVFDGPVYDPAKDDIRLRKQIADIYTLMLDKNWRTLEEIWKSFPIGDGIYKYPQTSISAQIRHLRKKRFGEHTVERRHRGDDTRGLYEYRLIVNENVKIIIS